MKIDAHQHFWRYDPVNYDWITDDMHVIRRDFLPADLYQVLSANGVDGCVAVQAEQTEAETQRLIDFAGTHSFIKGVVGWTDLRSNSLEERLEHYSSFPIVKGFRYVLQGEAPAFMLDLAFVEGLKSLHAHGFAYDILVFPQHLSAVLQLLDQCPDHRFVIDHIAKPMISKKVIDEWAVNMKSIAAHPNVYCKVSGMVTEADWSNWTPADIAPYLNVVVDAFGMERLMFGSDWPVCLVASSYERWMGVLSDYFKNFSERDQASFFGENAIRFYQL